ncbi:hypothetical protein LTR10_008782 [Elasticomyces elasticus]|nr:hypothetical protein LTR10_008782 [Elasticomyces elasticus]
MFGGKVCSEDKAVAPESFAMVVRIDRRRYRQSELLFAAEEVPVWRRNRSDQSVVVEEYEEEGARWVLASEHWAITADLGFVMAR